MSDALEGATFQTVVRAEHRLGFVDLTARVTRALEASGVSDGFCVAYSRHTTCALLINEWENGAQEDLLRRLDLLVPEDGYYAHDDLGRRTQNLVPNERANGRAHVIQMIVGGTSQVVPVADGRPALGRWQRVFLLELDEPKDREVVIQAFGVKNGTTGVALRERCELEPSQ